MTLLIFIILTKMTSVSHNQKQSNTIFYLITRIISAPYIYYNFFEFTSKNRLSLFSGYKIFKIFVVKTCTMRSTQVFFCYLDVSLSRIACCRTFPSNSCNFILFLIALKFWCNQINKNQFFHVNSILLHFWIFYKPKQSVKKYNNT